MNHLNLILFLETFHIERDLLLKEVNSLKKIKQELEDALVNKNVEVAKLKENLNRHHVENTRSSQDFNKLELQVFTSKSKYII